MAMGAVQWVLIIKRHLADSAYMYRFELQDSGAWTKLTFRRRHGGIELDSSPRKRAGMC